jgi:tRNA A-37 threonylcarbamoyl transferase component Bud32
MTGRVIAGRYNLQHPIGRGAMGVVWRARDQILDRDVAVKEVVISSLLGEEERRNAYQRTLREARTAARLSHRGLVAVYDVAEEDGRPWIVMELVPSRSLDQVLTVEGRLPPLRVARIGQQLLSALAAAHLAGVLHRDVKPSNVLIATDRTGTGWDERAVLTDFGIAQFEGDPRLTQTGMVMGSPGFTAPERIRGGDATHASDLWSLGATLYAAVEGRGPYEQRGGAITTMSAIINEDAPIAAHAGRLAQVIAALLRRDPAMRPSAPTAARMFAHVLSSLAGSEEATAAAHPPTMITNRVPPPAALVRSASAAPPADTPAADAAAPAVAATAQEDSALALALHPAAPAGEAPTPSHEAQAEPPSAEASTPMSAAEDETPAAEDESADPEAAAAEPGPAAEEPEASTPEAASPAAADDTEATVVAAPTPPPDARADDAAMADKAEAAADGDADAAEPAAEVVSAAETVSAVEAVSAIEALKTPDDIDDADVPVATGELVDATEAAVAIEAEDAAEPASTGEAVDAAEPVEVRAEQAGAVNTATDHEAAGPRPSDRSAPVARTAAPKPKPSPSFTAARPGERSATPTFSAARPATPTGGPAARPAAANPQRSGYEPAQAQYGAAQYGAAQYAAAGYEPPKPGSAQYGANLYAGSSYGGPSAERPGGTAPYLDQSIQYTPGTGGGRGQRRLRPGWRLILLIGAVLVAVAIGAGAAIALGHHGPAATAGTHSDPKTATTTPFSSVNALNDPSSVVPAGWIPDTQEPSANNTNAGFTISVPPSWTEQRKGLGTYFHGPNDMLLEIDLTPHKYPNDMVREAKSIEQGAIVTDRFPHYQRVHLVEVPVRGTKGAFWQFTWSLNGVTARTDDILFVMPTSDGSQSYAVYLRGRSSGWGTKDLPVFDKILRTFQTIPPSN